MVEGLKRYGALILTGIRNNREHTEHRRITNKKSRQWDIKEVELGH